ncbi:uncharacterized protein LOC118741200 isoform X3 [Rhagoletis pomonella]|uniref:uncharacterized protein LOC118741200 isoform X3 n=1 Tax=Rhagoletis pomonella TaxID=28610 RepID=UPI00178332C5|nr:uncharacterized protein LOC118741200 isoform X3 [Rhagoletis pomonella]
MSRPTNFLEADSSLIENNLLIVKNEAEEELNQYFGGVQAGGESRKESLAPPRDYKVVQPKPELDKKLKITNGQQFELLVAEIEKNPSMVKGCQRGVNPTAFNQQWEDITNLLNAHGPPLRDSDGWQRVWRDLKFKVKKKFVKYKLECSTRGGRRKGKLLLNPLDEAVANLLQIDKLINPLGVVQGVETAGREFETFENAEQEAESALQLDPLGETSNNEDDGTRSPDMPLFDDEEPTTSADAQRELAAAAEPARRKRKNGMKYNLLQEHTNMQETILTNIATTLKTVKNVVKESARYQRKLVELEEEKLELLKRRDRREQELYESEMKIKRIELLLKEKQLEELKKCTK